MDKFTIKTLQGLEEVLAKEVKELGGHNVEVLKRAVSCEGDQEFLYKANISLRTAICILKPIFKFRARNEQQLYDGIKSFNWSKVFNTEQTFAITAVAFSKDFTHTKYVALKSKDAIADQFREKTGERPSIDIENPDIKINIHIANDKVTVSLDSSGDTLNKRGYRKQGVFAPLNEVLAAGLLRLSGWDKKANIVDPMCGSGTLLIEAAMMANNIAPNLNRSKFAFQNWKDYNETTFKRMITQAKLARVDSDCEFFGSDISDANLRTAVNNSFKAGIGRSITFEKCDVRHLKAPFEKGMIITNPPYGERLKLRDMDQFYREIGDTLKKNFQGYDAWIISSNKGALKRIGLATSKKLTIFNAALECKFHKYEMYQGTKKNIEFSRPPAKKPFVRTKKKES